MTQDNKEYVVWESDDYWMLYDKGFRTVHALDVGNKTYVKMEKVFWKKGSYSEPDPVSK